MSGTGLIPARETMSNVKDERFLQVGQPIVAPTLVEPVVIQAQDKSTSGIIYVDPLASGTYQGAITLNPGVNSTSTTRGAGITVRTGAGPSTIIDVGTNTQANNILNISGTSGSSQVYDGKYNPVIKTTAIFDVDFALNTATPGTSLFTQAFTITTPGAYMLQIDINYSNTDTVPGFLNPVIPTSGPSPGAVATPLGALEWTITTPEVQYMSSTIHANSFIYANQLSASDPMDYTISNMGFLTAGSYSFNIFALKPNPAVVPTAIGEWKLDTIKARVVQMC
jgi:hypothetical protein